MGSTTFDQIATARIRASGVPEDQIPPLLPRAVQLLQALDALAELDAKLAEPALTWDPALGATP